MSLIEEDRRSKSGTAKQKIGICYMLFFPLRVVEGSIGESITIDLNGDEIGSIKVDGKTKRASYSGVVRVNYPEYIPTSVLKNKDKSGSTYAADGKAKVEIFRANAICMELTIPTQDILRHYDRPSWLERMTEGSEKKQLEEDVIVSHNDFNIGRIFDYYMTKVLTAIRMRSQQYWINQPIPICDLSSITKWSASELILREHSLAASGSADGLLHTKTPLDEKIWKQVGRDLVSNVMPELHEILLQDASYFYALSDYRRAIIDLAIAFEVYASAVKKTLKVTREARGNTRRKSGSPQGFIDRFDDILELKIGRSLQKECLDNYLTLRFVFEARNKIMHDGAREGDCIEITYESKNTSPGSRKNIQKKRVLHWDLVDDGRQAVQESITKIKEWLKKSSRP